MDRPAQGRAVETLLVRDRRRGAADRGTVGGVQGQGGHVMDKPLDLEQIIARCAAATPGPWTASLCEWECDCYPIPDECSSEPDACGNGRVLQGAFVPETKTTEWGDYCDMNDADAEFCAHAREDIPALIAEVERLRTVLDAAVRDIIGVLKHCECGFACYVCGTTGCGEARKCEPSWRSPMEE